MLDLMSPLGAEHDRFRDDFRSWLVDNVPTEPVPDDQDEMYEFQRQWHLRLHSAGWAGIDWPIEHGGRGLSPIQKFVYYEELARAAAPRLLNQPALILVGPTLMVHGSAEQKERYLPGILSASDVWCQGFSEPDAGSDLAAMRTTATLEGDKWVINGQKIWTTWAMYASQCALLCRTDPELPKHKGLSMIIVDMDQPGVEVRPITMMTGRQEFCEVFFTDAVAPREAVIGGVNEGWAVAMTMLEFERSDQSFTDHARLFPLLEQAESMLTAARDAGTLAGAALASARDRIVSLWTRYQVMRAFNLESALTLERGERIGFDGSVIKLYWSELYQDIGALALDLQGPSAIDETRWTELYLEGRAATIYSGTSEIQRNIIADRIAGLPRA